MVFVDIYERGHFFLGEIIKENDDDTTLVLQDGKERTIPNKLIYFKHYTKNKDKLYKLQSENFKDMDPMCDDPEFENTALKAKRYDDYATILKIYWTVEKQKEITDKNETIEIPDVYDINFGMSRVYNIFDEYMCEKLLKYTNQQFEEALNCEHRKRDRHVESKFIGAGDYWENRAELGFKFGDEIVDQAVSIIREKLNLSEEKYVHAESSSFVSDPNSIRQILHIDFKTENTYYVFVALQDVTTENGPTILIPRTASDEVYKKFMNDEKIGETINKPKCIATTKKGDGYIFETNILHGGLENVTDKRRIMFGSKFYYKPKTKIEVPWCE